jgi:CheY-like chemotaxis protein
MTDKSIAPSESESHRDTRPGRCVLIVDDVADCATSLAILLRFQGHEVHVAHSAREALDIAERLRPTAIFMDIGMPHMDGFEAIELIRAQPWGRDILICALTAFDGPEHFNRSRELGVDHHLLKPPELDRIIALLAE